MGAKVLVFGVDAMEVSLVDAWIQSGALPTLASLLEKGLSAVVTNPPRRFSGASWPNFYTSVGPRQHGQYLRPELVNADDYRYRGRRPHSDRVPAFWTDARWQNKRVAAINVPYAPLHEGLNGMQVVEWGVHDCHDRRIRTWPTTLAADVLSRYGPDPVGRCEIQNRSAEEFIDFRDKLLRRIRAKRDMICHYLQWEEWDLFVSVLDETHCVGHQAWHIHDPQHPRYQPALAALVGNPIKQVYEEIDRALASVLDCLGDDCTVIFVSSHGMGPTSDGNQVFDEILRRIEGVSTGAGPRAISTIKRSRTVLPRMLSELFGRLSEYGVAFGVSEDLRRRDRSCRAYFAIPTLDPTAGVRINLAGREKAGFVQPGAPCERLISQLTRELRSLIDGATGRPLVGEITRRAEIDFGGYEGEPPDLIVEWAVKDPTWIESPSIGPVDPVYNSRAGDHRMLGFAMARGPSVRPVQLDRPIRLEDFGPTIARLLGVGIANTDGEAIPEIVGERVQTRKACDPMVAESSRRARKSDSHRVDR